MGVPHSLIMHFLCHNCHVRLNEKMPIIQRKKKIILTIAKHITNTYVPLTHTNGNAKKKRNIMATTTIQYNLQLSAPSSTLNLTMSSTNNAATDLTDRQIAL